MQRVVDSTWARLQGSQLAGHDSKGNSPQPKLSVGLVTVTDDPSRLHPDFNASRLCYAERQGISLVTVIRDPNATHKSFRDSNAFQMPTPHFDKVLILREHLSQFDWILLSDSDTVMVGDWPLKPSLCQMGDAGIHLIFPKDGIRTWAFSNFAMFVRNSSIGRHFIELWWEERWAHCGWYDQCPCWRAILRVLWGGGNRTLPRWNNNQWESASFFNARMVELAGRVGSGSRWPNASEVGEDIRVGPALFSGTHFVQMKHTWLRFRLYCPLPRMAYALKRALIVHADFASGTRKPVLPLSFSNCQQACSPHCVKVQMRSDVCDPKQEKTPMLVQDTGADNLTTIIYR